MFYLGTIAFLAISIHLLTVSAHGVVTLITAGGQQYTGYDPAKAWKKPAPDLAGWSIPDDSDTGFVGPDKYTDPDIICHRGATPGKAYVTVAAGDKVNLKWSQWPESHHGPVLDYLANCNGDCTTVDKTTLKFNKIAESGLIDDSKPPGYWGADKLREAGASWTVTIPQCIAPGNYVLRHEIIALHGAFKIDNAQNYPQCINLKVTGGGTNALASGASPTTFYKDSDPGIMVGIYNPIKYVIPGPPVWSCGTPAGTSTGPNGATSSNQGFASTLSGVSTQRKKKPCTNGQAVLPGRTQKARRRDHSAESLSISGPAVVKTRRHAKDIAAVEGAS